MLSLFYRSFAIFIIILLLSNTSFSNSNDIEKSIDQDKVPVDVGLLGYKYVDSLKVKIEALSINNQNISYENDVILPKDGFKFICFQCKINPTNQSHLKIADLFKLTINKTSYSPIFSYVTFGPETGVIMDRESGDSNVRFPLDNLSPFGLQNMLPVFVFLVPSNVSEKNIIIDMGSKNFGLNELKAMDFF